MDNLKKLVTDAWGVNELIEALRAINAAAKAWESAAVKVGKAADAIRKAEAGNPN